VAAGHQRAHSEFSGETERFLVALLGVAGCRRVAMRSNLAEKPEGPSFVTTLLVATGEGQGAPGGRSSIVDLASQEVGFP